MSYIVVSLVSLIVGAIAGALVFRNNSKKAEAALADAQREIRAWETTVENLEAKLHGLGR